MNLLARPSEWIRSEARSDSGTPFAGGHQHYFAFLSYSHRDAPMAKWLHRELESFTVPKHLVGRITEHGAVPRRLTPIFRDLGELPASDDLGHEIRAALTASRYLIVLCSPSAAKSFWTNAEIEVFKRVRPEGCVLAAICEGEPFTNDVPGREHEECLPKALRCKYDKRGRQTAKRAEPLAADLRQPGEMRRLGFLKLVAGMLGVGLDDLVRRDTVRRHQRMAILASVSLFGMIVTSGLAITAIQARDSARDQRREAEGLVGFMLGDLRIKLEPLGRLDVMDSVGARALEYYQNQDTGTLSDDSLAQRSKALTLLGEISNTRGNLGTASRLYRAAYASTKEALQRSPDDPQRIFDHAQNVYWLAYIGWQQGRLDDAIRGFNMYRSLSQRLVATDPQDVKWKIEPVYADNALGAVLMDQGNYQQASATFRRALDMSEALASSEPENQTYQYRLLEALAWLADANRNEGQIEEALAQRERQLALLDDWMAKRPDDKELTRKAMTAHRATSKLLLARGDLSSALDHARRAGRFADTLIQTEPGNTEWMEYAAGSKLDLGALLRINGDLSSAASSVRAGCDIGNRLMVKDSSVRTWREDLRLHCLQERAKLALQGGSAAEGLAMARDALAVAKDSRGATPADGAILKAAAFNLVGHAMIAAKRGGEAAAAWQRAEAIWPRSRQMTPDDMALKADIARHVHNESEMRGIAAKLDGLGYRNPEYLHEAKQGAMR